MQNPGDFRQGHAEAGADRVAVDGRDDRHGQRAQAEEAVVERAHDRGVPARRIPVAHLAKRMSRFRNCSFIRPCSRAVSPLPQLRIPGRLRRGRSESTKRMKIAQGECSNAQGTWPGPGVRARTLAGWRFKPCAKFPSFSESFKLNMGVVVCQATFQEKIFSKKNFGRSSSKTFFKKNFHAEY